MRLNIDDARLRQVRGIPAIQLDLAAPETLSTSSIAPLRVGDQEVSAYATTRIAGEKLRAFLTSLPEYRAKIHSPPRATRVKDIYDLHVILTHFPLPEHAPFWADVAREFRAACLDRFVDCEGLETFEQDLQGTRGAWATSAALPREVAFDDAWESLRRIVAFAVSAGVLPMRHELPPR